jgi:hypothetical protein
MSNIQRNLPLFLTYWSQIGAIIEGKKSMRIMRMLSYSKRPNKDVI